MKAPKLIDVSKLNCPGKLEQYQEAVQATILINSDDPSVNFSQQLHEAVSSMLGFVKKNRPQD